MTLRKPVDAIFVPAARQLHRVGQWVVLAETLNCTLVVLCSAQAKAVHVRASAQASAAEVIAIDVPAKEDMARILSFDTARLLAETPFWRPNDTSEKRNMALLVAQYVGWERIFFLDDDIFVGKPEDIRRAGLHLREYPIVGLAITGFPDGSVASHAHRELGGRSRKSIATGAVAIAPARVRSFFPDIYNEDLCYLIGDSGLLPIAITGTARQQAYDPFLDPGRAAAEEFGEVWAVGLLYWIRTGYAPDKATYTFWRLFLQKRDKALKGLVEKLQYAHKDPVRKEHIGASLQAARETLAMIKPELCVAYLQAWMEDKKRWAERMDQLARNLPTDIALAELGLTTPMSARPDA